MSAEPVPVTMTLPARSRDASPGTGGRLARATAFALASLAAHGAALWLALNVTPDRGVARATTTVTLEVPPPPPATMEPQAPPDPTPAADPPRSRPHLAVRASRKPARPAASDPPPPPHSRAPMADPPLDMTGVTLTGGADAGWAAAAGDGSPRRGPLVGEHVRRAGAAESRVPVSSLVGLASLSRRPQPPELAPLLERLYPVEARRTGTSGEAEVAARVRSDGRVDRLRVLRASAPAFADACRQVLADSRWTPPLDRAGAPCATEIRYTCRFQTRQ